MFSLTKKKGNDIKIINLEQGRPDKMRKGFTLIEIMITVVIIALLVAIALPDWLKTRIKTNENNAQKVLKLISTACEDYAAANSEQYPLAIKDLVQDSAGYLEQDYTAETMQGYNFACNNMTRRGYTCTAVPVACNTTGTKIFTINTDRVLTSVACSGGG